LREASRSCARRALMRGRVQHTSTPLRAYATYHVTGNCSLRISTGSVSCSQSAEKGTVSCSTPSSSSRILSVPFSSCLVLHDNRDGRSVRFSKPYVRIVVKYNYSHIRKWICSLNIQQKKVIRIVTTQR